MDIRSVLETIRNFFRPIESIPEPNRKRRAIDSVDSALSPKCRKLQLPLRRDFFDIDRENYFVSPRPLRRPAYRTPPTKNMDLIVLDDDDDFIEAKRLNGNGPYNNFKKTKCTSTPQNIKKTTLNGFDDDVSFVKELKSPYAKKTEASKKGLNYIKPFSGSIFRPRTLQTERQLKERSNLMNPTINDSSKNILNYSIRLDDKMQYKKLLESSNDESSIYLTPVGRLFNYDTANRRDKIMARALKSPTDSIKGRMSTRDTIKKVLGNFENESILVKDSDSDSDVVLVRPPSPKPDFKVDPVNSFKKVVDTAEETKPEWLEKL